MRAQTQFLIRGTQLIAVLTFGAGFAKQQIKTSHITNSDLAVRNDPVKDFVEIPHSEYSSSLTHRPSPPRRSATFSSIKSTTTIRSFLVKRGLANKSNKQSWHDDVSPQDAHEDTPLDGVSAHADPESEGLAFESRVRRDVSDPLEDFDDQVSEISTKQSAWQHQEDGGKDETDNLNDDLMVPHAFLIHQIPWQLHQESIALFLELSGSLNCSEQLHDHEDDLRGDLARLLLWGESFDGGKLDDILAGSAELRDVVLELCATVSEILIEGKFEELITTQRFTF